MDTSVTSILSQFDPRLAVLLGWVALVAKLFVDWIKTAATLPTWAPPALAFGASAILILLLMLGTGIGVTGQLAAQAILIALIATIIAIGSTALQSRTLSSTQTNAQTTVIANTVADKVVDTMPTVPTVSEIVDELDRRRLARGGAATTSGLVTKPPTWMPSVGPTETLLRDEPKRENG